ncbi:hypothetical protein [Pseudomonas fluorescens]|uniref:Uncharacterized protein n=2 Tax=Pseudomonas fluorescens TaxID=294 RepID=A0ABY1TJR5_PSEFL|nr:hypothetical protein [Pseudomonas fluorescens]MCI4606889.1 hypothetical protein [Pseudomonas fluorescens]PQB02270.1 hypothetical protein B0A76_02885 [Pseudomonas fluorescens]RMO73236.1 hypothetical protein ALQ35_02596 [Pseudomonas fluorescens]SNY13261.1 hypothetical protein SAMN04488487_5421 [Pseudomonas fluorescens]SQF91875.1 Uncharacterised protein [Pseudomonas fluorescens]
MVTDQELGELFAKIGFKVDLKGIQQAKAVMKALEAQARNTGKAIDKALKGTGGAGQAAKNMVVAQQAQTKAQHQAQLQNAKLAKINNSSRASGLKTQQQQVALQIKQAQLAAQQQKAAYAAAKAQALQHAQAVGHQIQQSRLANLQQQHQIRAARAAAQQHAANRRAAGQANTPGHGGPRSAHGGGLLGVGSHAIHRFGGVGRFAGGVTGGAEGALGGLEGLAGGLGRAAMGLGAVAGAAALVVAAFAAIVAASTGFARAAERAANTRNQRLGQFQAVGDKTPENAARMNNRFENFAQTEGLSTKELGADYSKIVGALSSKVGVDKAANTAEGIFRYGKAQHLSNENMSKISLGMRQALGKGQLFSEEWTGQIAEHLGAHANEFGAEAWQKASGGKLTGDEALKAFGKDRQDRKISGDALTRFMMELGKTLDQHANDGGLLDKARNTQDSWDNRIANQYQANMASAFDNTGLETTMPALYSSLVEFLKAIEPQFEALGRSSSTVLDGVTGMVKGLTELANWFNNGKSYFDPKFMQDLSSAMDELGTSFTTYYHTIKQAFGIADDVGVFKTVGETLIGVITAVVDAITTFADVITYLLRKVQDGLHFVGKIDDDKYDQIVKQREVDDKQRADIVARRELDRQGGGPMPNPAGNVDPTAPWRLTDGSDIPKLDTVVAPDAGPKAFPNMVGATPKTPLVQPAVNGQAAASAVNNNVVNTITLNQAPITLNGVAPEEMKGVLEDHRRETERTMQDIVNKLSPARAAATQSQARGN